MDFEITWTEPAADELEAIGNYIGQHSHSAAERIVTAILNRVELLGTVPLMGRVYRKDPSKRTREVICGNYRIFYRVLEDAARVEILTAGKKGRNPSSSGNGFRPLSACSATNGFTFSSPGPAR